MTTPHNNPANLGVELVVGLPWQVLDGNERLGDRRGDTFAISVGLKKHKDKQTLL